MNPQFQQFQEQMRHQQEQSRKQQEMAHWYEQKKRKDRQESQRFQAAALHKRQPDTFQPRAPLIGDPGFARVELQAAVLRQDLAAGRLTEPQFKEKLRELMLQDAQGHWWMVGAESGGWYRFDGANWMRAEPPGHISIRATPQPITHSVAPAEPQPRKLLGALVFALGLVLTVMVGGLAIEATEHGNTREISFPIGIAIWLVGGILTIIATRKVWRRQ
jgi:hypothetical protein